MLSNPMVCGKPRGRHLRPRGYNEFAHRLGVKLVNLSEEAQVEVDVPSAGLVKLPGLCCAATPSSRSRF